jgi:hypothetical protein
MARGPFSLQAGGSSGVAGLGRHGRAAWRPGSCCVGEGLGHGERNGEEREEAEFVARAHVGPSGDTATDSVAVALVSRRRPQENRRIQQPIWPRA